MFICNTNWGSDEVLVMFYLAQQKQLSMQKIYCLFQQKINQVLKWKSGAWFNTGGIVLAQIKHEYSYLSLT